MRVQLNKWRRVLGVTLLEACIVLILCGGIIFIGGCVIIKLCRKLDAMPPLNEDGMDVTIELPTSDYTNVIGFRKFGGASGVVPVIFQRSTNGCDWEDLALIEYAGRATNVTFTTNFTPTAFFRWVIK